MRKFVITVCAFSLAFLAVSSILLPKVVSAAQCTSPEECLFIYDRAIQDAATVEPTELEPLTPITVDTLKVATWTDWNGYHLGNNTLSRSLWVTVVPRLQEQCQTFDQDAEALDLRLKQLLGLAIGDRKSKVVEFTVSSADLFRPCPNPDITATECTQTFPDGVSPAHTDWFAKQVIGSYEIPGGYPWTRLGYTYDWNPDTSEVGLNEYLVRAGSTVGVTSITPTADYCS